ncbi:hypothetical protein GCM10028791_00230 [Echinicola sediminis]
MVAAGFFGMETFEAKGQEYHELKGPKAKNYKPWKEKARKGTLVVNIDGSVAQGPTFKNEKVWERRNAKATVNTELQAIDRPKGPKAKNKKVWKND